jgi:hypothetical protein
MIDTTAIVQEVYALACPPHHCPRKRLELITRSPPVPLGSKAPGLGCFVWMEVNGDRVDLYNVKVEGKVVSAFVESVAGAEVAVCFRGEMKHLKYDLIHRGFADGSK